MPRSSAHKPFWIVRNSSIHQRGVFAREDIPNEAPIIEYIGEKIDKAESERRGLALMDEAGKTGGAAVYIFTLNETHDLDGGVDWNPARLINHSCNPNAEAFVHEDDTIWIYAKREIRKGEELTFNYGFDLDTWEDHPCRCGSENCVGYIVAEEYWPKLKEMIAKRERIKELKRRARALKRKLAAEEAQGKTRKKTAKKSPPKTAKSTTGKKATAAKKKSAKAAKGKKTKA